MSKVNLNITVVVCALIMTLAVPAGADTHYVTPGQSIQTVIDDPCTVNGDQIEVAQGTYNEAINFNGKAVRLYSSSGPLVTIIDANGIAGAYHTIQCLSGEDANTILEGFTITGGNANGPPPDDRGGGMYNDNSSPTITSCIFTSNKAKNGGGILNYNCNPTVNNCNFENNTALGAIGGGGIYNHNSSPTVTNCTFSGNLGGPLGGGGMFNATGSNPTLINCMFSDNNAVGGGGGIYNWDDTMPILTNCTFNGNSATNNGGGMYNKTNSSPTVTNCTFSGNSADYDGGGMYNYNSSPTVTNCILWGDTLGEIYNYNESSDPNVTYCDVEGGTGQSWFGTGCIDADPCFVNADANDFRLLYDSPCIDAGDNNSVPADTADLDNDGNTAEPIPFDANGVPRVLDGDDDGSAVVDMGAYEYELPPQIHNITQNTWYYTIQEAIDDANDGDEIEVAAGTYNEAINFNGKAVQLYSSSGPLVTIIDANGITGAYHAVQCVSGEDANTILEGFTITGGNANGPSYPDRDGGGMYNVGSSPTVTNCIFKNNKANHGGGMLNVSGSPTVTGCTFQNNVASGGTIGGGGMYNHNSSPLVTNCTFSGNYGEAWGGGGMFNAAGSNPTLINCMFSDNNAVGGGGGIYNGDDTMPILTNCTFSGNLGGPLGGGGMFNATGSNPTLINCMFSDNNAVGRGGGIYNGDDTMPILTNCTFSGNSAYLGGGMFCENSSPAVTNCTFSDNIADEGGGMCNWNNSSPTVTNCTFSGNSAYFGGGMFCENSSPAVTNCTFSDNSTEVLGGGMCNVECSPKVTGCTFTGNNSADGGGMFNWEQSSPTVTNCTFSDNSAYGEGGGGMYNYNNSSPTVTNCTFSGNIADADGGGMFNYNNGSPTVTNCTFSGNIADANGGGMWNYMSSPTVTNCILWGDTAAIDGNEIALLEGSTIDVNYCDVRGGQADIYKDGSSTVTWGININADPLFVDPCNPDPNLRNFRLAPGSPCIDAANNDFVPADTADLDGDGNTAEPTPYDLDGHPRFVDGDCNDTDIVDMGAYEFNLAYYGDLDCDCDVDVDDLAVLCDEWLLKKLLWDVREDGFVNFLDWAILANGWQDTTNIDDVAVFADQWLLCGAYRADIAPAPNGEGVVNMLDFATLAENWLLGAE